MSRQFERWFDYSIADSMDDFILNKITDAIVNAIMISFVNSIGSV